MDSALIWLTIAALAAVTYGNRSSFVLLAGRIELPHTVRRALRYVPPAVLTALVVPALILPTGDVALSLDNHRLWAGIIAAVVAWCTRNMLFTLITGMAALHLARFALGA
jgi:branched-subunit amino acid transport protein